MQSRFRYSPLLAACLLLAAHPLPALDVEVQCGASGSLPAGVYGSINAALAALPLTGPHTVSVQGTCQESVRIEVRDGLTIEGSGDAVLQGVSFTPLVFIGASRRIEIRNLTLLGAGDRKQPLVQIEGSAAVSIAGCRLENGSLGVEAYGSSFVRVSNSVFEAFSSYGIWATDGGAIFAQGPIEILGARRGIGAWADGVVRATGPLAIEDAQQYGVFASSGGVVELNLRTATPGMVAIRGAGLSGIYVQTGQVWLSGPAVVEDCGSDGVHNLSGAVTLGAPPGGVGGVVIRNNPVGVSLIQQAKGQLSGVSVEGNTGAGVTVSHASTLLIHQSTITANLSSGVEVTRGSSVNVMSGSLNGNGGSDLLCNTGATAFGDREAIGQLSCPGFAIPSGPKPKPVEAP